MTEDVEEKNITFKAIVDVQGRITVEEITRRMYSIEKGCLLELKLLKITNAKDIPKPKKR